MEKEENVEDFELSLELSIGRRYGRTEERVKTGDFSDKNGDVNGNNIGFLTSDFGAESLQSQRKKEIQALRRQEARKKREERMKKSRVVEDRVFLEAQKLQIRVRDRDIRERDEDLGRRNGSEGNEGLYPKVQHGYAHPSSWSSLERSSSAVSDYQSYQSTSQKAGENNSDTGSQSSRHIQSKSPVDHTQLTELSSQAERNHKATLEQSTKTVIPTAPQPNWGIFGEKSTVSPTANSNSTPDKPSTPTSRSSKEISKPHNGTPLVPHMPCVSTTGNGPNGKTITGFLYKYTNNEVSIMCICHGSSFSPAEFVEHAGGVNISNPLRHITVVQSSLECS